MIKETMSCKFEQEIKKERVTYCLKAMTYDQTTKTWHHQRMASAQAETGQRDI